MSGDHPEAEQYAAAAPELERAANATVSIRMAPCIVQIGGGPPQAFMHYAAPGERSYVSSEAHETLATALEDCANRFERCCLHSGSDKGFAAHAVEDYRALVKAARGQS